jgi:hypothetical protein
MARPFKPQSLKGPRLAPPVRQVQMAESTCSGQNVRRARMKHNVLPGAVISDGHRSQPTHAGDRSSLLQCGLQGWPLLAVLVTGGATVLRAPTTPGAPPYTTELRERFQPHEPRQYVPAPGVSCHADCKPASSMLWRDLARYPVMFDLTRARKAGVIVQAVVKEHY